MIMFAISHQRAFIMCQIECFLCLFNLIFINHVAGLVQIVDTPYPLYIMSGTVLSLTCRGDDAKDISWIKQSSHTSLENVTIVMGSSMPGVVIKDCRTTGLSRDFRTSTLTQSNLSLGDRGKYSCYAGANSYHVLVTVLFMQVGQPVASDNSIKFNCVIGGFETNPPSIEYDWFFNGSLIPRQDTLPKSGTVQSSNQKYYISFYDGSLTLAINNPGKADTGSYLCSFSLGTNQGTVTFTKSAFLNVSSYINLKSHAALHSHCLLNYVLFAISSVMTAQCRF